jgi:hypothetical protein
MNIKNFKQFLNEYLDNYNAVPTTLEININDLDGIDVSSLEIGDILYQEIKFISPTKSISKFTTIEPKRDNTQGIYRIKEINTNTIILEIEGNNE